MISSCSRLDIIVIELGSIPGSCHGVAPSRPKRGNPTNGDSMPKHTTLRKNKIQKRNIEGIDWIQWIESEDFQRQAPATGSWSFFFMQSKEQNVELTNICVVHSGNDVWSGKSPQYVECRSLRVDSWGVGSSNSYEQGRPLWLAVRECWQRHGVQVRRRQEADGELRHGREERWVSRTASSVGIDDGNGQRP